MADNAELACAGDEALDGAAVSGFTNSGFSLRAPFLSQSLFKALESRPEREQKRILRETGISLLVRLPPCQEEYKGQQQDHHHRWNNGSHKNLSFSELFQVNGSASFLL